jgi:hypothetical protein
MRSALDVCASKCGRVSEFVVCRVALGVAPMNVPHTVTCGLLRGCGFCYDCRVGIDAFTLEYNALTPIHARPFYFFTP